jgi:hypothetical protein
MIEAIFNTIREGLVFFEDISNDQLRDGVVDMLGCFATHLDTFTNSVDAETCMYIITSYNIDKYENYELFINNSYACNKLTNRITFMMNDVTQFGPCMVYATAYTLNGNNTK